MTPQIDIFVLALAHSLFIGALIAVVVAIFLRFLPDGDATLRSLVCLSALYALFALFLMSFFSMASHHTSEYWFVSSQSQSAFSNTLFTFWMIGMLITLSRTRQDWLVGELGVRQSEPLSDITLLRAAMRHSAALGVTRPISMRQTQNGASPWSFGLWRPVILMPAACFAQLSTDELEAVLAHEIAHIARFDFLHACLTSVIRAFLFFNPAVHWLIHQYRIEAEKACDDLAVGVINNRESLASGLLRLGLATSSQLASAASGPDQKGRAVLLARAERLLNASQKEPALKTLMTLNGVNVAVAAAILSAIIVTAGVTKHDVMSEDKLISLKRALCDVLEEDNIFGNPYYDPGGPATLLAVRNRDEVTMNGKTLPVDTAESVKKLFAAYHVDYGDVTHMRYLAKDIELTVKTRLNNGGRRATVYQTYADEPGLKISRRRVGPSA